MIDKILGRGLEQVSDFLGAPWFDGSWADPVLNNAFNGKSHCQRGRNQIDLDVIRPRSSFRCSVIAGFTTDSRRENDSLNFTRSQIFSSMDAPDYTQDFCHISINRQKQRRGRCIASQKLVAFMQPGITSHSS